MTAKEHIADLARLSDDACRSCAIALDGQVPSEPVLCGAAVLTPEEVNAQETSRQAKLALAIREQRAEIIRHLYAMVLRRGQIVTLDEAARDWIPNHAAAWRAVHEDKLRDTVPAALTAKPMHRPMAPPTRH